MGSEFIRRNAVAIILVLLLLVSIMVNIIFGFMLFSPENMKNGWGERRWGQSYSGGATMRLVGTQFSGTDQDTTPPSYNMQAKFRTRGFPDMRGVENLVGSPTEPHTMEIAPELQAYSDQWAF